MLLGRNNDRSAMIVMSRETAGILSATALGVLVICKNAITSPAGSGMTRLNLHHRTGTGGDAGSGERGCSGSH